MRVMIVEDEALIALEIESIVRQRSPKAVIVLASTVQDAFAAVDDATALAFLDIDLPDGKTYALALELRAREVPFTFVSGARPGDAPPDLLDARFIAKPFSSRDISDAIDALTDFSRLS